MQYLENIQEKAKASLEQVKKEWVTREILRSELANQETGIIGCMFGFMVCQIAVLTALIKFLK